MPKFRTTEPVVEVTRFRLKAGTDPKRFKEAAAEIMPYLRRFAGFQSRELLYEDSAGWWVDILYWSNMGVALTAAKQLVSAPEAQGFMSMIDGESVEMMHLNPVGLRHAEG